jgi:hypothetical protein
MHLTIDLSVLMEINVFQMSRTQIWRQVGVMIGVLGDKSVKIETKLLGELDEEFP